ncbi:hypothetical protein [Actinacidiphila oryziradicis]|uniref:Uncharacterized protein n=1 Tax=Actinacidiphila oryziradicis TaxID=2571141 RepID=A0A4U0RKA8_9ACTN|nr:hypothetical protein [Actinacidiphila oryziradicis]TJZ95676.1 hypothetical protein FCI23_51930 [Actinacidiphila oryziradicis]
MTKAFGQFRYPTSPLAPVADLQLRSLLAEPVDQDGGMTEERMTSLFARIARETEGIQDLDDRMDVA